VNLPAGFSSRPATEADLDAVVALLDAVQLDVMGDTENVREYLEWIWHVPYADLARDTALVSDGADLVGYGEAYWDPASPGPISIGGVVRPSHRGRGIGTAILEWSMELGRTRGAPGLRHPGVYVGDLRSCAFLEANGFEHVRNFYTMALALPSNRPPVRPEGIEILPFRTGRDEHALYENHEATFADHWGFVPESYETFVGEWYGSRDWVPELAYLAWAGGEAVGHAAALEFATRGYIGSLGVVRAWRGRGVAQALLHRAFADLAARGYPEVTLGVDASSPTGAVALYEKVGMSVRFEYRTYDLGTDEPPMDKD
jgi:GNAT superfamily N-acetyltransferase